MPVFEVPKGDASELFSANVGFASDLFGGQIRVEPPFNPGEWLKTYFENDGLLLEHVASTDSATLFNFSLKERDAETGHGRIDRTLELTRTLLDFLGEAESLKEFTEEWTQFDHLDKELIEKSKGQ